MIASVLLASYVLFVTFPFQVEPIHAQRALAAEACAPAKVAKLSVYSDPIFGDTLTIKCKDGMDLRFKEKDWK